MSSSRNSITPPPTTTTSCENENVWASLPVPLCDVYLHSMVAQYLTVPDLLRLSAVSRRYRELFDCSSNASSTSGSTCTGATSKPGRKILAAQLRRDARHKHPPESGSYYTVCDVLPTLGNLTVDESLEQDPWTVAQLRKAALRRRKLVLIQEKTVRVDEQEEVTSATRDSKQEQLQEILANFRPKAIQDMVGTAERYGLDGHNSPLQLQTEFICINQSGQDLFCHWINDDGQILVREGDYLPPESSTTPLLPKQVPPSFWVEHRDHRTDIPPHIFCHASLTSHSFALCRQPGGTPFAVYQSRRVWHWHKIRGRPTQVHAIAVLPGGTIQELQCHSTILATRRRVVTYDMYDRSTGARMARTVGEHGPGNAQEASEATIAIVLESTRGARDSHGPPRRPQRSDSPPPQQPQNNAPRQEEHDRTLVPGAPKHFTASTFPISNTSVGDTDGEPCKNT